MKPEDVKILVHSLRRGYAHLWEDIGTVLGFMPEELEKIKNSPTTPEERLEEVLHQWSLWPSGSHPHPPTKERLNNALYKMRSREEYSKVGQLIKV